MIFHCDRKLSPVVTSSGDNSTPMQKGGKMRATAIFDLRSVPAKSKTF
jgi:hypothetical protein